MSLDIYLTATVPTIIYEGNLTHNLGSMASAAGIYEALWRPEDRGWTTARDILPTLRAGLAQLKADPDQYRALNPPNGWGTYEGLVRVVEDYLAACEQHPDGTIHVSR